MSEIRFKRSISKEVEETVKFPDGNEFFISAKHPHCNATKVWFAKMKNGSNWIYVKFSERFMKTDFSFEVCDYTHRSRLLNVEEFLKWCNCSLDEVHFLNKPILWQFTMSLWKNSLFKRSYFSGIVTSR